MADTTSTHIIQYIGDLTNVANKIKELTRLNQLAAQQLGSDFGKAVDIIDQKITSINRKVINVPVVNAAGNAVRNAAGNPLVSQQIQETAQLTTTLRLADGSLKTFKETQTQLIGPLTNSNIALSNGAKVSRTFADELKSLGSRALLTIPIWIGIRFALTGMFQTINNGAKNLVDFDLGLQKVKRNLSGTPEEISADFKILRDEVTKTSLETGVSTEQISEAIKKFATIGFNFKDSLQGGIEATKLSVVLFGDASETANAFARALKILNDTSKGTVPIQQQIQEAFALTAELEKTNQFDLNEVTESLIKFAGTAKTANLSTKETLSLLAALGTAGRAGAQGGTLLSTSINTLLINLDKVTKNFGIKFNPALDSSFTVLTQVLDKAAELSKLPGGEENVITKLADVFGGQRGTKAIESLLALNDQLKQNIKIVPNVVSFHQQLKNVLETESGEARIVGNSFKEFGKSLVTGLLGTDDFTNALKKLNEIIQSARIGTAALGGAIRGAFSNNVAGPLVGAIQGLVTSGVDEQFKNINKKITSDAGKVLDGLNNILSKTDLNQLIIDIKSGAIQLDPIVKEKVLAKLNEDLSKLESPKIDIKPTVNVAGVTVLESDRLELAKAVEDARINQLKSEGALSSEILKQQGLLNQQLNIYDSDIDKAKRRLEIEHAVNEEKRLQNRLGSDSIKLFDIAQNNGIAAAKAIGDVLAGNTSFDTFVRQGGAALEIFKKEFADVFKQQQAQEFFTGTTVAGNPTLRGGTGIAINETALRNPGTVIFDKTAASELNKAIQSVAIKDQTVQKMTVVDLTLGAGALNPNTPNLLNNTAISAIPNRLLPTNTPGVLSSINQLKALQAQGVLSPNAQISITVDFNGTENVLIGKPDSIIGQLSDIAAAKAKQGTIDALKNAESPISKAVNTRQEEF